MVRAQKPRELNPSSPLRGPSSPTPRSPTSPLRGQHPSSPDIPRRPTPAAEKSPSLTRNRTFVRPSRLPVVSVYNPKPPVTPSLRPRKSSFDFSSPGSSPLLDTRRMEGRPTPSVLETRRTSSPKRGDVTRRVPSPPMWRRSPSKSVSAFLRAAGGS